jgi:hypothetical protein
MGFAGPNRVRVLPAEDRLQGTAAKREPIVVRLKLQCLPRPHRERRPHWHRYTKTITPMPPIKRRVGLPIRRDLHVSWSPVHGTLAIRKLGWAGGR